jgi:MFS family permease
VEGALAALGISLISASAIILALTPNFLLVFLAEILHGVSSGIITPAIAAISLGLVGRKAMSARTGRNYGFDAAGNALTAGAMGLAGQYVAKSAIFLGAAALRVPALVALSFIRSDEMAASDVWTVRRAHFAIHKFLSARDGRTVSKCKFTRFRHRIPMAQERVEPPAHSKGLVA